MQKYATGFERRTPSAAVELDGPHIDAGEWHRILDHGFDTEQLRAQVWLHVAARCRCWREGLELVLRESTSRGRRLTDGSVANDPVLLTLRDWLELRRTGKVATQLLPAHRYWVRHMGFEPLGFCRAVLERSRQLAIKHPDQALEIAQAMLRDLSDDRLRRWCHEQRCDDKGFHESRFHDLRVLALALVAECHQMVVDFHEAEKHFRMAESELVLGSGDSEIRATLYELQADFVQARGLHFQALGYVETAVKLVAKCQIPGRLAESLTRKGIILMRANSAGTAAEVLANALEKMPGNVFPLLRLETRHRLAAAEVQCGDFKSALKHLRAGKHLYKRYPQKLRDTQRQWLLGVSYLYTRKFKRAEKPLREALDRYCNLRLWEGAAQALANLAELYIVTHRHRDFAELEREFCRLVQSAAGRKLALAGLRKVLLLAEKLGITAPTSLRELLRELEEQEKGMVN